MDYLLQLTRFLVPPKETYSPTGEPDLSGHRDCLNILNEKQSQVNQRFPGEQPACVATTAQSLTHTITEISAWTERLANSQLDTRDIPHSGAISSAEAFEVFASLLASSRDALSANDAQAAVLFGQIAVANRDLAAHLTAIGAYAEMHDDVVPGQRDPGTGAWMAKNWKWPLRTRLDDTLKARRDVWTARDGAMAAAAARVALLHDLVDLLQNRFELVSVASPQQALSSFFAAEQPASDAIAHTAARYRGYRAACGTDLDALAAAEARAIASDKAATEHAAALDEASRKREAELEAAEAALEEERARLRANMLKDLMVAVEHGDAEPDPLVQSLERELAIAIKRVSDVEKQLEEARVAWMDREAQRRAQAVRDAEEEEIRRRGAAFAEQSRQLDDRIKALHAEVAAEVASREARARAEAARKVAHDELLAAAQRHRERLECSVRNADAAGEYCDTIAALSRDAGRAVRGACDEQERGVALSTLAAHSGIYDVYVELYTAQGQMLYDKERHIEEVDEAMGALSRHLDFCVDTHDPNAHRAVAVLSELDAIRAALAADVAALGGSMAALLQEAAISEAALRRAHIPHTTCEEALAQLLGGRAPDWPPCNAAVHAAVHLTISETALLSPPGRPSLLTPAGGVPAAPAVEGLPADPTPNVLKALRQAGVVVRLREPTAPPRRINLQPPKAAVFNAAAFPPRGERVAADIATTTQLRDSGDSGGYFLPPLAGPSKVPPPTSPNFTTKSQQVSCPPLT